MRKPSPKGQGFTLIELLIVVAIIGIIAAIAIPNLLAAIHRSKQKRSMADMHSIATAWEARAVELTKFNAAGVSLGGVPVATVLNRDLERYLSPTYIRTPPRNDGWGNAWIFYLDKSLGSTTSAAQVYEIVTRGRNATEEDFATNAVNGQVTNFDCDIIYSGGVFMQFPQGVQAP